MLTADLVRVRRRGDRLHLVELTGAALEGARAVADEMVQAARDRVGRPRAEVDELIDALATALEDTRLGRGLAKVLADACTYPEARGDDAERLRGAVWRAAAAAWTEGAFDRDAVLRLAAPAVEDPGAVEDAMWRDQPEAARLEHVALSTGDQLVDRYVDDGLAAVLTRAVSLSVTVEARPPELRTVLRKLAFLTLAVRARALGDGRYSLEVEGPLSMHGSAARYGMRLAMLVPTLRALPRAELAADLRWGPRGDPLAFSASLGRGVTAEPAPAPAELTRLVDALRAARSPWTIAMSDELVEVPGELVLAPDIVLQRGGARVFVELVGHWSRSGLWRRIESAARLPSPMIFVASSRLRVSEEALDAELPASLYVYKGVPSAKAILARAEQLIGPLTSSR